MQQLLSRPPLLVLLLALAFLPSLLHAFSMPTVAFPSTTSNPPSTPTTATTTTTNKDVLQKLLHKTAARAAPPGSNRRHFIKKLAKVIALPPLVLGGGPAIAAAAGASVGVDKTPGRYSNVGAGSSERGRWEEDGAEDKVKREVLQTTRLWLNTVTSGKKTAAADTVALYAKDAVLWGTVSEQLRVKPEELRDYFDFFASLPGLRVAAYQPYVRVYGDATAINDGYYVFAWRGPDGKELQKHARYSFVYRKETGSNGKEKWMIVDHHSSLLPTAPQGLKKATTVVL